MAPANTLWKSAVVVSWFQRFAAFVLGKERIYKVGTHDPRMQKKKKTIIIIIIKKLKKKI